MRALSLITATSMVAILFAGCISSNTDDLLLEGSVYEHIPLDEVYEQADFATHGSWSQPLPPPLYEHLQGIKIQVPSFDGVEIEMGIIRPDIPGCPDTLDAAEYPEECKTPVLMDSGPYFTTDSISELKTRPPTSIWMVPYGYTVVHMAVRGTGGTGGCMEFMSEAEQQDVDEMVTWAAEQPWSTGNIGMIGRSYDGTTPFMAAALGNPNLKTIVPISGVADVPDLMFSNGTSEFRGPIMHNVVYWATFGIGATGFDMERMTDQDQYCEEVAEGTWTGLYTSATGDWSSAGQSDYWQVRQFRERILDNYEGSLYIVHGMQDWNVNPRMVVPWINELQDEGFEVKALLGQWGHAYPDRTDEHENTRWDWADTLLRWFDRELKGMDVDTGPAIEVEDFRHDWWVEDSYPPRDATRAEPEFTASCSRSSANGCVIGRAGVDVIGAGATEQIGTASFVTEETEKPTRVSGLVRMDIPFTATTASGTNLYVNLYDIYPDGRSMWGGHGWINTEYYAGGNQKQELVPGQQYVAKLEFEPMELFIPAGHQLRVSLTHEASGPQADVLQRPQGGPVEVDVDNVVLDLPLVEPEDFERSPYRDP